MPLIYGFYNILIHSCPLYERTLCLRVFLLWTVNTARGAIQWCFSKASQQFLRIQGLHCVTSQKLNQNNKPNKTTNQPKIYNTVKAKPRKWCMDWQIHKSHKPAVFPMKLWRPVLNNPGFYFKNTTKVYEIFNGFMLLNYGERWITELSWAHSAEMRVKCNQMQSSAPSRNATWWCLHKGGMLLEYDVSEYLCSIAEQTPLCEWQAQDLYLGVQRSRQLKWENGHHFLDLESLSASTTSPGTGKLTVWHT